MKSNLPQLSQPNQFAETACDEADPPYDTHLINLLFVQVEHLARTRGGNFFIDFISNMVPVITVSSEHKYHLCFLKKKTVKGFSEINMHLFSTYYVLLCVNILLGHAKIYITYIYVYIFSPISMYFAKGFEVLLTE